MYDLTTPDGVFAYMSESTSENDWDRRSDDVREANGGSYPIFWYKTVGEPNLARKILGSGSSGPHISKF